jgi:hypothetical protein
MPQKGNALLIVLLSVLIVGAAGYFIYSNGYFSPRTASAPGATDVFNYGTTSSTQTTIPNVTSTQAPLETGDINSNKISLTVVSPVNGATLNSTSVTLTGKTSPGADVFVNDQQTKADANGNFSFKLTLDEGQNGLVVTANDADGNVAEQDISVNVQSF